MTVVARRVYPAEALRAKDQPVSRADPTIPPRFVFAVRRLGPAVVVSLHGELAGPAVAQLEDVLHDLICGQGNLTVVVDVRDLSRVDRRALALFSAAADWACQVGGTFRLHEVTPFVSSTLEAIRDAEALDPVGDGR